MTKSRIELQTIIIAVLCTFAVSVIGQKTLYDYQEVKKEKIQLTEKENICQMIEVAPYASWFQSLDGCQTWYNEAFQAEFGAYSREKIMRQLTVTDKDVVKTNKPHMQVLILNLNDKQNSYNVLTYPVYGKSGAIVGVGGVAIAESPFKDSGNRTTLNVSSIKAQPTEY